MTDSENSSDAPVLIVELSDHVATITLNRPAARNALNAELRAALPAAIARLDENREVDVIILTGAGPAFCSGLDLKELGAGRLELESGRRSTAEGDTVIERGPFPVRQTPMIGAINGAAITGGFELALNCDFLVASHRAIFADTHARVGVMPGWGLAVLLPAVVGFRRARELSLTGNFLSADEALRVGLVNHVVDHDDLLPTARRLASDIAGNHRDGVRQMLRTYDLVERSLLDPGWAIEAEQAEAFRRQAGFDPREVERRRQAIIDRGRQQLER